MTASTLDPETPTCSVFYDGQCPLCAAEIGMYRGQDKLGALTLIDASAPQATLPPGLTRQVAMARFHVLTGDGRLLSGAEAFVAVWQTLPNWRWLAGLSRLPGMLWVMEAAYRLFLPVRPYLSKAFGRLFGG